MKIRIGDIRQIIREVMSQETWPPGRYYPAAEPVDPEDAERLGQPLGEEDDDELGSLEEVDTDPSNNPGRPADAAAYLGMRPAPTAALAHPAVSGGPNAMTRTAAGGTEGP